MERYENMVVLSKQEVTEGTDPTPTKLANAVLASEVRVTPIVLSANERKLALPHYGNQGKLIAGQHAMIELDVEAAGSGAAGTAPAYGVHLKCGGMSETVSAGVSVTYAPIMNSIPSAAHYLYWDGSFHKFLGGRCNVRLKADAQATPMWTFSYLALYVAPTATAMPTDPTLSAYVAPVEVNLANTTFSLHSYAAVLSALSWDLGNDIKYHNRPGAEAIRHLGRKSRGSVTIEAPALGSKNYFTPAVAGTKAALQLVHGVTAGNIITLNNPYAQLGDLKPVNLDGVKGWQIDYDAAPSGAGNDEASIVFT